MYYAVTLALIFTMALALARAIIGPSVYDRVLAVNMLGTKTVLLLAVIAFLLGRPDFLDLALAYALINFIGVLAVLEFFRKRAAKQPEGRS
ncbi:MAG: multicomponent Na+:H+ antiporter subunit F [Candidatus Azotimanducaceae bacterium]|jgi:multicomponent Na+:H+ antiporter subunit F